MKSRKSANVGKLLLTVLLSVTLMSESMAGIFPLGQERPPSRHSDQPSPFLEEGPIPSRPHLMLEVGDKFLDTGNLARGVKIPLLGTVWQPRLWSYLTLRSSLQYFDVGTADKTFEWANRADFFFNLQLTGTEKIILGIRPLDINRFREFSGYNFVDGNGRDRGWFENWNTQIRTLFMEGDIGSLIPNLDKEGYGWIDFGYTVGRQPIIFQEGILINDDLDAVGLTRNNLRPPGFSNLRISGLWAWNDVDRTNAVVTNPNSDPQLFALFTNADFRYSTINWDMLYVNDNLEPGDAFYNGFALIQRVGHYSVTIRANTSWAFQEDTAAVADGALLSAEFSKNIHRSDDIAYWNFFTSIENYTQAGREPIVGGPLAALGILFASPNLGGYGAEMSPLANRVAGTAIGYQAFWDDHRRNLTLEFAMRRDLSGGNQHDYGFGFQGQQAISKYFQAQLEGFWTVRENNDDNKGSRFEFLVQW